MSDAIQNLLAQAGPKAGSAKWEDQLDPDVREILAAFEAWLVSTDGKKETTARAYRSYVAESIVRLGKGEDYTALSTDLRSGVNAFVRFSEATRPAADEPGDDEPEA